MTLKIPILAMRPKFSKQSWSSEAQKTPTKHQRTEKSVRVRRILVVQERRGWRGSGEQERRAAVAGRSRPRRRSQRGSHEVGQRKEVARPPSASRRQERRGRSRSRRREQEEQEQARGTLSSCSPAGWRLRRREICLWKKSGPGEQSRNTNLKERKGCYKTRLGGSSHKLFILKLVRNWVIR